MSEDYFSPHWYRVAKLKPRLSSHVEIHRHDYRGLIWYMLQDSASGRGYRFNSASYQAIALMDGSITVEEVFQILSDKLGTYAPTQVDMISLLGRLYDSDLILSDQAVDTASIHQRQHLADSAAKKKRFANPLAIKIPLWDPDEFLLRHQGKVRWCFSAWMAVVWLVIISYSSYLALVNWPAIQSHFSINALQPNNLLMLVVLYPLVKLLHELAHGFATRLEGGEVHEMGITILLMFPVPYVNVSSSAHFRNKYKRMLVSSAGIALEMLVAALGLLLYLNTQPGLIHDIGFNLLMIGGISSLLFNGNPLLKFDGYYVLADAVAIPNLYQRAYRFWLYLLQRYLLGMTDSTSPATAPGEEKWFLGYASASFLYRLSILWFICILFVEKFLMLGLILAAFIVLTQFGMPLLKGLKFLIFDPALGAGRTRAIVAGSAAAGILVGLICFVPVASYTMAEGVVWVPEDAQLKAGADGFVQKVHASPGQVVGEDTPILELQDLLLSSQEVISRARLRGLQVEQRAARGKDRVESEILRQEVRVAEAELQHISNKSRAMSLVAPLPGELILMNADDLVGRFLNKGDLVGYVLGNAPDKVRVVVSQDNIGQVRNRVEEVQVRFANARSNILSASIVRQVPQAIDRLPSAALSNLGGGKFVVDPQQPEKLATATKLFVVELQFNSSEQQAPLGTRAFVRFDHGPEPLGKQWSRRFTQAFLRHFDV